MENEFCKVFKELEIDRALLPVLMGANRSTVHKYLEGDVTNIPASAMTLIKLLQFLQSRDLQLFREWLVLQEFNTSSVHYLGNPEIWKIYKDSVDKMAPSTRKYLEETSDTHRDKYLAFKAKGSKK